MSKDTKLGRELNRIFLACKWKGRGEDPVTVVCTTTEAEEFKFDPGRLAAHREEIKAMLAKLPDEFTKGHRGKGAHHSKANRTQDGNLWTEHPNQVAQLLGLGLASNLVEHRSVPDTPEAPAKIDVFFFKGIVAGL